MFNLEQSITKWRQGMLAAGIQSPVPLEELESHLREEIDQRLKTGLNEQAAFNLAAEKLGHGHLLQDEFARAGGMNSLKVRKAAGYFYAAILGVYVLVATGGMFKNHLTSGEWVSGLTAQAVLLLATSLAWRNGSRFFPLIGSRHLQSAVGLLGGISGALWFIAFAYWILPRFDFTTGQLMVAIMWAMVPTLVLPTSAFLLLENSENRPSTAIGI